MELGDYYLCHTMCDSVLGDPLLFHRPVNQKTSRAAVLHDGDGKGSAENDRFIDILMMMAMR
jgi:hypothetical protein